ncbi:MAG: MoaD/ThiS family protein [Halobacteria archaeon]|nr:MoaD/ThiS family protein [Halobacteria archaeon]
MPVIKIPAVLNNQGGSQNIDVEGSTVLEALQSYTEEHGSGLRDSIMDNGSVKEYINVYVNGKDIRNLAGVNTQLEEDDVIRIIPAASGG